MPRSAPDAPVPAVVRLVQSAVLGRWRATGDDLYRELAVLIDARPDRDVLVAGSGSGDAAHWLADRTGVSITGVDPDPSLIALAETRARSAGRRLPLHYERSALVDLPHESEVFDAVIGEPAISAADDPALAVRELVRVTRPLGTIVLLQPTWTSETARESRELIANRLGLRPHLLVEWKQMLREAGVVEIQVQDWTSGTRDGRGTGPRIVPIPHLTWRQKMQIAGRAWRRWGIREIRGALDREASLLHTLSRERSIGLQLIKGVKWPHPLEP
jgi:SAM-dependent methyltransferase